jgi:hypothetical protein
MTAVSELPAQEGGVQMMVSQGLMALLEHRNGLVGRD